MSFGAQGVCYGRGNASQQDGQRLGAWALSDVRLTCLGHAQGHEHAEWHVRCVTGTGTHHMAIGSVSDVSGDAGHALEV